MAYLRDSAENVVAYRTFLQPDSQRPYVTVVVVAFNLQTTRLHFVLGYEEPASSVFISRPAHIPDSVMQPGKYWLLLTAGSWRNMAILASCRTV